MQRVMIVKGAVDRQFGKLWMDKVNGMLESNPAYRIKDIKILSHSGMDLSTIIVFEKSCVSEDKGDAGDGNETETPMCREQLL